MFKVLMLAAVTLLTGCAGRQPMSNSGDKAALARIPVPATEILAQEKGQGSPLILIHGGGLDRSMWDPQFDALARHCRVIRYDVRCHGESPCSAEDYADHEDLLRLLDYFALERAAILGLSLGARVAVDFALEHPDRVGVLILASPGLSGFDFPDTRQNENYAPLIEALQSNEPELAAEYMLLLWTNGPFRSPAETDPELRRNVRAMLVRTFRQLGPAAHSTPPDPPATQRLVEIRSPVLTIVGDLDMPDVHAVADRICAVVDGARREVITGAAHMLNMERPDQFNRIVLDYLRETDWIPRTRGIRGLRSAEASPGRYST